MKFKYIIATGLFLSSSISFAETLNNEAVVSLVELGLGEEAIVAKIKNSDPNYKLSIEDLTSLKNQGVSSKIIAAMISVDGEKSNEVIMVPESPDPMLPHPTGVYLLADWEEEPKMSRINYTVSNQVKTGGFLGAALTGGIASTSLKAIIPNASATTNSVSAKPVFYMFFDDSNSEEKIQNSNWASGSASIVTSPSEFTLISLKVKKGRRQAKVGKFNFTGAKTGVLDKDQIAFDHEEVRRGVYKVSPREELEPGEYGFIFAINGDNGRGIASARIFDFTILE